MRIEIDQSGKIEQTEKDTILCLCDDSWYAIRIRKKTKRSIQIKFRSIKQSRNFVLFTFCAGLSILIRKAKPQTKVWIDIEYFGKDETIKNILLLMLSDMVPQPHIGFRSIGKESPADLIGREIYLKRKSPSYTVSEEELLSQIKKTEVGNRLKNA